MKLRGIRRLLLLAALLACGVARAAEVVATMPAIYGPAVPLVVSLDTRPDPGTLFNAVEDAPPPGWTVAAVSHGGAFDPVSGKVKWGPFGDATPRVLQYTATPPADAEGPQTFVGLAVFDTTALPIGGDRVAGRLPGTASRTMPADYLPGAALTVSVAVAPSDAVRAWATEERVPAGWSVGAISHGGGFDGINHTVKWGPYFDAVPRVLTYTIVPPANSRADAAFEARVHFDQTVLPLAAMLPVRASRLGRVAPGAYKPGVGFAVTLTPVPAPYVAVLEVDEAVPEPWTPTDIGAGGTWDPINRRIKWGPYFGAASMPGTLGYRLLPAAGASQPLALAADARFDGVTVHSSATIDRFLVHPASTVARVLPPEFRPSQPLAVTVAAVPSDTVLSYAVEEGVPEGWTVSNVSHGGFFDAANRKVKWGPY